MYTLLVVLFLIVSIAMVLVILLQSSKGGLASSFGGVGAGGVMSSRGAANFLQKATVGLAIAYGALCLAIGFVGRPTSDGPNSIIQDRLNREVPQSQQPVLPTPVPPQDGTTDDSEQ